MDQVLIGKTIFLVIDAQVGDGAIPIVGYDEAAARMVELLAVARGCHIPIIHFQEIHRKDMVDFGRELDGVEKVHDLEGTPGVEIIPAMRPLDGEYFIQKRRYSCFFGTDLEILLKGLRAETLVMVGGLTDVCVHYTAVDAHQHDYRVRVVEDAVAGSSWPAHEAALAAIEYLQRGARISTEMAIDALRSYAATQGALAS
jgi:nicotinamidase-related amidase